MKVKNVNIYCYYLFLFTYFLLEFTLTAVDFGQLPLPFTPTWDLRGKLRSSGYSNYPPVIESAADCLLANCSIICAFFCPFFFFFFSLPLSLRRRRKLNCTYFSIWNWFFLLCISNCNSPSSSFSLLSQKKTQLQIVQSAIDFVLLCIFQIVTHPLLSLFSHCLSSLSLFSLRFRENSIANWSFITIVCFQIVTHFLLLSLCLSSLSLSLSLSLCLLCGFWEKSIALHFCNWFFLSEFQMVTTHLL